LGVKNCPWFSLRSNSIEGAIFWIILLWLWEKAKARAKTTRNSLRS